MTGKIKSKDLSYDNSLPPFLQRLRAQHTGQGDPDRHEHQVARPKKATDVEEDDGPTVVDETGETLSKDEVKKLTDTVPPPSEDANVKGEITGDGEPKVSGALPAGPEETAKGPDTRVTEGMAQKKRKAAKVVGDTDELREDEEPPAKKAAKKAAKKKAKPIRLAFDDD